MYRTRVWQCAYDVQLSIGCVRARFAKHIAILILVDACASSLGFYITGWAFAWGDQSSTDSNGLITYSQNPFIGSKNFAMHNLDHGQFYLWVFQWSVSPWNSPEPVATWLMFKSGSLQINSSTCLVKDPHFPALEGSQFLNCSQQWPGAASSPSYAIDTCGKPSDKTWKFAILYTHVCQNLGQAPICKRSVTTWDLSKIKRRQLLQTYEAGLMYYDGTFNISIWLDMLCRCQVEPLFSCCSLQLQHALLCLELLQSEPSLRHTFFTHCSWQDGSILSLHTLSGLLLDGPACSG